MYFNQELFQVFIRLGLVYVHLIACCVAIGLVLTSDLALVRNLIQQNRSRDAAHVRELNLLQAIVAKALVVLWVTGAAVCALDATTKDGLQYFANPKLQAKILIVVLLTVNGLALHHSVLPWLKKSGSVLMLPFSQTVVAVLGGVVSGVSWLYAAMLGVGRPLAWKYSLVELMAAYPLLISGGFMTMFMLTMWSKYRDVIPDFQVTEFSPRLAT